MFLSSCGDSFVLVFVVVFFFKIAEGQPESIVSDIENMVRSYVEKVLG